MRGGLVTFWVVLFAVLWCSVVPGFEGFRCCGGGDVSYCCGVVVWMAAVCGEAAGWDSGVVMTGTGAYAARMSLCVIGEALEGDAWRAVLHLG